MVHNVCRVINKSQLLDADIFQTLPTLPNKVWMEYKYFIYMYMPIL